MPRHLPVAVLAALLAVSASHALERPGHAHEPQGAVSQRAFFKPELSISLQNQELGQLRAQLAPGRQRAWSEFFQRHGGRFNVWLDPRSGTPTNIQGHVPLIPGQGVDNQVTLAGLGQRLGRPVSRVDEQVVGEAVLRFVRDNVEALGIDAAQLGAPRVTQVTEHLWQVHIPQQVEGLPVRHGRLAATLSHGNLVLLGTESWGNVRLHTLPHVSADQALENGLSHAGLRFSPGRFWKRPTLEVVPFAPARHQRGSSFVGPVGAGYGHRLAWTYGFHEDGEEASWEVTVDAHTGEVLALEDTNSYVDARVSGGVYPLTSTEVCPSNAFCGTMQPDSPMPWTNTGLPAPNDYTDGAGVYDYSAGTATTTLSGRYVRISDNCGAISFSGGGDLLMGGANGQHDCTSAGGSAGNTAAARSAFYEVNKLAEQARGWLPSNSWLKNQLTANVNINSTCNAFWNGSSINFYRSGGGCRNTGEIGAVFDHEWGHGMDDFDANGSLSNSSEAYADIAAIYRLQASCVGHGFNWTTDKGCGQTADGTSFNQNEGQGGVSHCNLNCSGVRDADWDQHADHTPDTPQNFVCSACGSGTGPCGRQVHCAAAPTRQAAWDLVARDLRAAPFNYDENTAFLVGNKLFYQGSGNVGTWHACDCTAGTSNGCGSTNGYMQWLAADDDNGNLGDGTPHMTAIYNAFNRHNIACNTPTPTTAGCSAGPSAAPSLSTAPGDGQVSLSWTSVSGAQKYWVMKTEGFAGCNFGKALTATVTGTTYTDSEVAAGRQYCYSIVAAGSSNACFSPGSQCVCATPTGACNAPSAASLLSPAHGATEQLEQPTLDWNDVASGYAVEVATDSAFTNVVRSASGLTSSSWTVSPALSNSTLYYWRVRATNSCGDTTSAAASFTTRAPCTTPATPMAQSPASGATGQATTPTLDWSDVAGASYDVQVASDSAFTNVVRSASALSASSWTVTPELANGITYYWRVRATTGCGTGAYSTGSSFTTAQGCNPTAASHDTTLKAPRCASTGACGCDTGTLVDGRGTMSPGEPNQPNALGTCADGSSGTYHSDESIDRVRIETTDAGALDVGKQVKVSVTVWCYGTSDYLDLYYTTNASSPTWAALATNVQCPVSRAAHTFTQTFTLGSTTGSHAVRAQLRYSGSAGTCTSGSYNDRDDLVFQVGTASCSAPAAPALASPASGSSGVSTAAVLDWSDSAGATSYDVQVSTSSTFSTVTASATGLATSSWTVSPALANATPYYWRARAVSACGASAWSSAWSFTTQASCSASAAAYSSTLKAPGCAATSCGCDSGTSLLNSRGALATAEPNQPNTLNASCADGSSGSYHVDESVDRIAIRTSDNSTLTPGKPVSVEITVWCYNSSDALDLYYTTNASSPSWTAIATSVTCPVSKAAHTFKQNLTLGSTTGQHAVRAQLRYGGSAGTCTSGGYNDRDDLYFQVSTAAQPQLEASLAR